MAKEIVLVTGSSGCLGQHIVKLLQEKDDTTKEIRLYDIKPYSNDLGHAENKPMKEFVADILDLKRLEEAMEGVDCVIHTAAFIDVSLQPDDAKMEEVNVRGTENVVAACISCSVSRLIFTSSVDIVIAGEHIFYGMENTTPVPRRWLLGQAAGSKYRAETAVTQASGRNLANGKGKLRTASLRPTLFYGESDNFFVTKMFEYARQHNGIFQRVHSLDERLQLTYVGNVAWAHITAKDKLAADESISGEPFYITDETPIQDIYLNTKPYFEAAQDVKLSENVYPYWMVWIFLNVLMLCMKFISPFYPMKLPPLPVVDYLCSTFFFNRTKAILRLDYTPIYTPEEAQERSLEYYKKK